MPLQTLLEQGAAFSRNHGDPVTDERIGTRGFNSPEHIFLMYLRFDRNSRLHVSHCFDALGGRSVRAAEFALMAEARPSHPGPNTHRVGTNFETMQFDRPCYFTIILDELAWQFYNDPDVPENPPLVFLAYKPGDPPEAAYDPNTNFYDAEMITINCRPALRCINYARRKPDGSPGRCCFEINLRATFSLKGSERYITVVIDPTGESKGPS